MFEVQHLAKPKDGPAPRWFHMAVAASMIISAVSALIATLHTGKAMNALIEQNAKLVRANSTPILEFHNGNEKDDGSPNIAFGVRNVGSGIARIVWFELQLDGKPMPDMATAIRTLSPDLPASFQHRTGSAAPRILAPNAEAEVFAWPGSAATSPPLLKAWQALDAARLQRISVQACYCSQFQECWTSHLDGQAPAPVAECSASGKMLLKE